MLEFLGLHAVRKVGFAELFDLHEETQKPLVNRRIHVVLDFHGSVVELALPVVGDGQNDIAADELFEVVQASVSSDQKLGAIALLLIDLICVLDDRDKIMTINN